MKIRNKFKKIYHFLIKKIYFHLNRILRLINHQIFINKLNKYKDDPQNNH